MVQISHITIEKNFIIPLIIKKILFGWRVVIVLSVWKAW